MLAVLLGQWGQPPRGRLEGAVAALGPLRRASVALGAGVCRADVFLRQWPVAGLSLLVLAILFGAALSAGR